MGAAWLHQVLAATDLSLYGNRAVGRAVRLGRLHGAPVTSVCVVPPRPTPICWSTFGPGLRGMCASTRRQSAPRW